MIKRYEGRRRNGFPRELSDGRTEVNPVKRALRQGGRVTWSAPYSTKPSFLNLFRRGSRVSWSMVY
jgi:hypothetical protein